MAEARFVGMLDYLEALRLSSSKSGKDTNVDKLFQSCMLDIQNAPPMPVDAGARLLKKLNTAHVSDQWREELAQLLHEKVEAGAAKLAAEKKKQAKVETQRPSDAWTSTTT